MTMLLSATELTPWNPFDRDEVNVMLYASAIAAGLMYGFVPHLHANLCRAYKMFSCFYQLRWQGQALVTYESSVIETVSETVINTIIDASLETASRPSSSIDASTK